VNRASERAEESRIASQAMTSSQLQKPGRRLPHRDWLVQHACLLTLLASELVALRREIRSTSVQAGMAPA